MASKKSLKRTVYIGTFVHSLSLEAIEVVEHGIVGVDEKGIITFVEKDYTVAGLKEVVKSQHGWQEWETVMVGDGPSTTFLFPGFVGMVESFPCASFSLLYLFALQFYHSLF